MIVGLVLLLSLCSFGLSQFKCSSPSGFEANNAQLENDEFKAMSQGNKVNLHSFLFSKGTWRDYDPVREIQEVVWKDLKLTITKKKAMKPKDHKRNQWLAKEIQLLKTACGKDPEKTYQALFDCPTTSVTGFKGCVEENDDVYFFEEMMDWNFSNQKVQKTYQRMSAGRTAYRMVEIINKFQALHEKGLIHGDIRPEVIVMKGNDFTDIRIANFGNGETKSDSYHVAMRSLMDPECFYKDCFTVQADVYSLAMTLASLEGNLVENMKKLQTYCFSRQISPNKLAECDKNINSLVLQSFEAKKANKYFDEIFTKATHPFARNRYNSMKEFADAIMEKTKDLPGYYPNPDVKPGEGNQRILNAKEII